MNEAGDYRLTLLGAFRLSGPEGERIAVVSKRGQALLAMLALSGGGERTRSWLQSRLWGSRMPEQGKASLRRELSTLRQLVNRGGRALLHADHQRVWIDLTMVTVDARTTSGATGEVLEGLDIPGEDGFEDWLRDERARMRARVDGVPVTTPAAAPPPAAPAPDFGGLPALAVLAFVNLTGDAAFDHVAEGMSEDLIDRLARLRWLPVIARSSSFALRHGEDARMAGVTLGARYVVTGQLRLARDGLALAVTLLDAQTGTQLWSSAGALPLAEVHGLIEDMILGVAIALGARVDQHVQAQATARTSGDHDVRDLIWRGKWHLNRLTREDAITARDCFTQALEREPASVEAIIQLAWVRLWDLWVGRADAAETREARKLAQRAVIADCDDGRGYMLIGIAESWLRQPLRAETMLARAIELNPSLVMARVQLGATYYLRGEPAQSIDHLKLAIRLSPSDQNLFFTHGEIAQAYLMLGDDRAALHHAEQSLLLRAGYWMPYVIQINALVRLGRRDDARAALAELRVMRPSFTLDFIDWTPFVDPRWNYFLKHGMNLADG